MSGITSKRFSGGYRFRKFAGRPGPQVLNLAVPQTVTLLRPEEITATVSRGDRVEAGQAVAREDQAVGSLLVSPARGVVESVGEGTIVIACDGSTDWRPVAGHTANWQDLLPIKLEEILYLSGATAAAPQGIPTRYRTAPIEPGDVSHIIVHDTEAEPFGPRLEAVLGEGGPAALAEGLAILKKIMPQASVHVALDRANRKVQSALSGTEGVELCLLPGRYPQHHEAVLVPMVVGGPYPNGYPAIHTGVLVLDAQAVIHVREAVIAGKPLIERIVALAGPGFRENTHVRVRVGSPVSHVTAGRLGERPARIVADSALLGAAVEEATPIGPRATALVAITEGGREFLGWARPGLRRDSYSRTFAADLLPISRSADTGLHGEHRPCLSCGFCDDVCPAGILPHLLHRYVLRGIIDEDLARYRITDCIDCNLCTYVCPSKIPVAQLLAEGKEKVVAEGLVSRDQVRHRLKGPAADQLETQL